MEDGAVVKRPRVILALFGLAAPLLALAAPAIAPIEPPAVSSFDAQLIARGAQLAAIGNCNACHTAPGGKVYAGGRALKTPFGTIYGTNVTPDAETGIGRWSEAAFRRAMHEGIDRQGRHLYPAFPYDHFTKLADEDVSALYAFMMTRDAVSAETPPNRLPFPFNVRVLIGVWKSFFFDPGRFQPNSGQSAEWNRGAYLVEGLGHCGACHTPRNLLGAEKKDQSLAGGEAEGWHSPALTSASPSPVPWTAAQLYTYLRTGIEDVHAIAAGPMAPVVDNLATAAPSDVQAIAGYVASLIGPATQETQRRADEALARASGAASARPRSDLAPAPSVAGTGDRGGLIGAEIYAGACASCHDAGRASSSGGALHLALAIAVVLPTPSNLIHLIVEGIAPPENEPGRFMPGFAAELTNDQIAALVNYLRAEFGKKPAWRNVDQEVRTIINTNGRR